MVLSIANLVQLAIRNRLVASSCHVEHGTLLIKINSEDYCCLYWVHVLFRQYLIKGKKHALIKQYALNKHVRLLTRLYGNTIIDHFIPCAYMLGKNKCINQGHYIHVCYLSFCLLAQFFFL